MTTYGFYVKQDTGTTLNGHVFSGADLDAARNVVPVGCKIVTFDESHTDFDLLYALLVDNSSGLANSYLPVFLGGLVYNFENNEFTFVEAPPPPPLIDLIREERNRRLHLTDDLALVPDYPQELQDAVLNYRAALRDITDNIDPLWKNPEDVVWPTPPDHI